MTKRKSLGKLATLMIATTLLTGCESYSCLQDFLGRSINESAVNRELSETPVKDYDRKLDLYNSYK